MLHVLGVLGRQHGADDEVGYVVEGQWLAVALRELAEEDAVGGVQLRQLGEVGKVEGEGFDVGYPGLAEVAHRAEGAVGAEEGHEADPRCSDDRDRAKNGRRDKAAPATFKTFGLVNGDVHADLPE